MGASADADVGQHDPLVVYVTPRQYEGCALKTFDLVTGVDATLRKLTRDTCDGTRYFSDKMGALALVEGDRLEIIDVRSGKDELVPTALPIPPLDRADMKNNYGYLAFAGLSRAGKVVAIYPDTETGNGEACMSYAFDGKGWSLLEDTQCGPKVYGNSLADNGSEARDASIQHPAWKVGKDDPWFVSDTDRDTSGCDAEDMGDVTVRSDTIFRFRGADSHLVVDRAYGCGADDPVAEVKRVALTPALDPHERVLESADYWPKVYDRYLMVCVDGHGQVYDLESGRVLFNTVTSELAFVP